MIRQAQVLLQQFADYVGRDNPPDVLSVYLVVDPADRENQAATPAWNIAYKNAIEAIEAGLSNEQQPTWSAIRARVETFLADYQPAGKTLVIFAGPAREWALDLPMRLENQVHYGQPKVRQFLWALDEYQEVLAVVIAQDKARTVHGFLGRSDGDRRISLDIDHNWGRRELRISAHEANIAQRKDELDRRFVRAVADEIASISHAYPNIERFILAGNQRLAHALRTAMHPTIAEQVIAVTPMPYETPDHEVLAAMAPLAEAYEREYELAQIEDVISRAQAGRRGALGLPAVQEALDQHAVRRLFLPFPENQELVEELLVKAVASSSDIEFVHGDAAERLQAAGGVGAHLYYQL